MASGAPSIPTVRAADPRAIEGALAAIRERFRLVEAAVQTVQRQAGQTAYENAQGGQNVSVLQAQITALRASINQLQATGTGATGDYRADAAVTLTDVVFPTSDGGVSAIDTQNPLAMFAAIGIAETSAAAGSNVRVRRSGPMTISGASFEVGRAVYAQVGSGLTQYPNYASVAIPVGVAISASAMDVRCAWPALQEMPVYAGGYEDFLPVTLGLIRHTLEFVESVFGQADGIVVKVGGQLFTRSIITPSGSGIEVTDGDGALGDPTLTLTAP